MLHLICNDLYMMRCARISCFFVCRDYVFLTKADIKFLTQNMLNTSIHTYLRNYSHGRGNRTPNHVL